jgi:hypothetical protein
MIHSSEAMSYSAHMPQRSSPSAQGSHQQPTVSPVYKRLVYIHSMDAVTRCSCHISVVRTAHYSCSVLAKHLLALLQR